MKTELLAKRPSQSGLARVPYSGGCKIIIFIGTIYRLSEGVLNQSILQLQRLSGEAVEVLRQIMINKTNPPTSRIACAKAILDHSMKGCELEDLAARIDSLEKSIENR